MELIYYRSEIKKITGNYQLKVKKAERLAKVLLILFIILSLAVIGIVIATRIYSLLIIIAFFLFIYFIFYIIKYFFLKSIFFNYMHMIQEKIINGEGKYNINILKKNTIIELVREVRFAERYDYIRVNEGFKVKSDDYEGYYFSGSISRSNGNSSMVVINGEFYILKLNTISDYQIRNDNYRVSKMKKFKFPEFSLFASNPIEEVNDDNFFFIKKLFSESKYVGIDYSQNHIGIFNVLKFKNPTSFVFNDKNITDYFQHLMIKFGNLDKMYQEFSKESF